MNHSLCYWSYHHYHKINSLNHSNAMLLHNIQCNLLSCASCLPHVLKTVVYPVSPPTHLQKSSINVNQFHQQHKSSVLGWHHQWCCMKILYIIYCQHMMTMYNTHAKYTIAMKSHFINLMEEIHSWNINCKSCICLTALANQFNQTIYTNIIRKFPSSPFMEKNLAYDNTTNYDITKPQKQCMHLMPFFLPG